MSTVPVLIDAIRRQRWKKILLSLHLGWDVNVRDPEHLRTPLIELAFLEREHVAASWCKRFLLAGGRPDLKDLRGRNALHWACVRGRERLVEIFVNNWQDYDINAQDHQGNTALSLAVISSNESIVRKLVTFLTRFRLSVDVCNNNGETPLILASKSRNYFLRDILVKYGRASTEIRDKQQQLTAKEWESWTQQTESKRPASTIGNRNLETLARIRKLSKRSQSVGNTYKIEVQRIFGLYQDEMSSSFRQSAIPPPQEDKSDISILQSTCYENQSFLEFSVANIESCPITRRKWPSASTSEAAQVRTIYNSFRRTKNSETVSNYLPSRQDQGKFNAIKSIVPKLEVTKIAPVVKRSSCPVLRKGRSCRDEIENLDV